ncbi:MAG: hypothetical protein DRP83_01580, partial [Planctomycetota bacterium]
MLNCNLCGQNAWQGEKCSECPLYQQAHYLEGTGAQEGVHYFCVAESPYVPGVSNSTYQHTPWGFDVEKIVKRSFADLQTTTSKYRQLQGRFTYAVRCSVDKPLKVMREACSKLFHPELLKSAHTRMPIMVFALGPAVLQSLGIKVSGYKKVQGRMLDTHVGGRRVIVMPSLSKRQLAANPEHHEIFMRQVQQFLDAVCKARDGKAVHTTMTTDMIIKDYRFPKSENAVRKLIEEVIEYSTDGRDPEKHLISVDTETNTLYPHLEKLRMLSFVFSWGPGKAASIPVEHAESPLTLAQVAPYIQQLLSCPKPKAFHNAKFDLKVLRRKGWDVEHLAWDTMLGEHLLAEAKKGYYDLKSMTQSFLPQYGGYEDELQAINKKRVAEHKASLPPGDPDAPKLTGAAKKMSEDFGFGFVPLKHLHVYGAIDADVTRQLALLQRKRMIDEQHNLNARRKKLGTNRYFQILSAPGTKAAEPLKDLMFQQLLPVTRTLARMEEVGMRVDRPYVLDLAEKMDTSMLEYKIELLGMIPPRTLGDQDFNPKSVAQLRKILFGAGYLHPETHEPVCHTGVVPEDDIPYTDTGLISTNAKFLRVLKNQYDCRFSDTLLKYRALTKARDTFVENIMVLSEEDGRMHTNFKIHGTATGRLSSVDENMQNIPKKIGNHNIKRCFIPTDPDSQVIMNADAKAAEVRIYAAYSRDKNLITALNEGLDPHSYFSSMVLNPATILDGVSAGDRAGVLQLVGIDDVHDWSYEDFQKRGYYVGTDKNPGPDVAYGQQLGKLRSNIKRVVFGILYGAAPKKIAGIVGIPEAQAAAIIDSLFKMFPTIPEYISRTKEKVQYLGCVETFFGRRRRFNLRGMTFKMRNKAERQAVNMLIQSTSSEIIMRVLNAVDEPIRRDFEGNLLITVHDSLVAEIPKKYVSQMPDFITEHGVKRVNDQYRWLPVPFLWDVEVGPSYGQLSDVDKYLSGSVQETEVSGDDYLEHE